MRLCTGSARRGYEDRWRDTDRVGHPMKKLTLRNNGQIKEAELNFGDLTLLVGPQASGKPNEQEKHNSRPVSEDDAEFSVAAIGLMLREIGWARP